MTRAFQQFSRFRLGKELVDATQHHLLQQDQVGQRREILEPLTLELGKPAERLAEAEEAVQGCCSPQIRRRGQSFPLASCALTQARTLSSPLAGVPRA